jgi:hypothetical protein
MVAVESSGEGVDKAESAIMDVPNRPLLVDDDDEEEEGEEMADGVGNVELKTKLGFSDAVDDAGKEEEDDDDGSEADHEDNVDDELDET